MQIHVSARFLSFAIVFLLAAPVPAQVSFEVDVESSSADGVVRVGDEVILNIRMDNTGESYNAIYASFSGYERNRARFDRGRVVDTVFSDFSFPGVGCFGGLSNGVFNPIVEDPSVPRVRFLLALTTNPQPSPGLIDIGIDGELVSEGDYHFSVTFQMLMPGVSTFDVGTQLPDDGILFGDGSLGQDMSQTLEIYVVPEPSVTLMFWLGLAGLGSIRLRPSL